MRTAVGCAVVTLLLCTGCLDRKLEPLSPCLVRYVKDKVTSSRIDKVDVLFMVDNSSSMKEEQASLKDQFPKLIRALTTGDRDGDGNQDFEPATDLHIGVVSSDLGLPGVALPSSGCSAAGDDGIMNNIPSREVMGCQSSYPRFLSYTAGVNDPDTTARDFACVAQLGTGGCGYEQQLESPLKALWPSIDPSPDPKTGMNRVTFLSEGGGNGQLGRGDRENAGFLRSTDQGSSLLAVVVVSDEDDCSSSRTDDVLELKPEERDVRCFLHKDALYPVSRYVEGFKALRPDHPELVVFAAIVGVPKDLVDAPARAHVRFDQPVQRDAYYRAVLADPRMQEQVDSSGPGGQKALRSSCQSAHGLAAPPRRIVEVAQGFGENGIVQSVCQDDFGPAMDAIVELLSTKLGSLCVPYKLVRDSKGLVGCNIVWELPTPDVARPGTPTQCGQTGFPFLLPPDAQTSLATEHGGAICNVAQLAVVSDPTLPDLKKPTPTATAGQMFQDGWYYDNYSPDLKKACSSDQSQRLAFTKKATPPNGVVVRLECFDEHQSLPMLRSDALAGSGQPSIGDGCDQAMLAGQTVSGDAACEVRLNAPTTLWPEAIDRSMFCHPKLNLCVRACATNSDCPPAWVCDDRPVTLLATSSATRLNGSPICISPTCDVGR